MHISFYHMERTHAECVEFLKELRGVSIHLLTKASILEI